MENSQVSCKISPLKWSEIWYEYDNVCELKGRIAYIPDKIVIIETLDYWKQNEIF